MPTFTYAEEEEEFVEAVLPPADPIPSWEAHFEDVEAPEADGIGQPRLDLQNLTRPPRAGSDGDDMQDE